MADLVQTGLELALLPIERRDGGPQLRFDALAVEGVGEDVPDQPQALDDEVRPVARRAECAGRERADGMLPDPDRDRQVRLQAEAAHVRLLRPRVLGEVVGKAEPDGLTPDELRVVPGQLGLHDSCGVGLHPGARPRGGGREARPIRRELEQRAPVGVEELDEPTQAALDLLVDALHGQPREAGREVGDEALGSPLSSPGSMTP